MLVMVFIITAIMMLLLSNHLSGGGQVKEVTFLEYQDYLRKNQIKEARVVGEDLTAQLHDGFSIDGSATGKIRTKVPPWVMQDPNAVQVLSEGLDKDKFSWKPENLFWYQFLPIIPWILLFLIIWFFFIRQIRSSSGPGNILSFGRSRARFITPDRVKTTFADVAGVDEAKEEVAEIVEFLRSPQKFSRLGGRIPHGVLLVGPPGTGKTLLAKAISGEAGVPFLNISCSDFVEMFVGVGASRVRDLFRQARENSPCIVFLDEIDAVGRRRGTGLGGGHDEREQTLNQILVEMDGFDTDEGIIVMAATNRQDVLDPALLRPGRFDRQVHIDLPDVRGREEILRIHAKKVKLGADVDLKVMARGTAMMSGADLAALINESAIIATIKNKDQVDHADLEEARDKVLWGRQKRSRVVVEEEKKITAYHEAGHTLVGFLQPECEPVHKVTIIPRGRMGGATMSLPERDRMTYSKGYCLANITMLFGGRVAEETFFNEISTGAGNDIQRATELARRMVCEWGMSEALGPLTYTDEEEHFFLGREVSRTRTHSEEVARKIDAEMRRIVDTCYAKTRELITTNRDKLEAVATALLKYETLTGDEVRTLVDGGSIDAARERAAAAEAAALEKAAAKKKANAPGWKPKDDPLPGPAGA
jgi:cell division protease FtsH